MSFVEQLAVVGVSVALTCVVSFSYGYLRLKERVTKLEGKASENAKDISELKEGQEKTNVLITKIGNKVITYCTKMDFVLGSLQNNMVDYLHHPNNPERDRLIEHLKDGVITSDELDELYEMLEKARVEQKGRPDGLAAANLSVLTQVKKKELSGDFEKCQ